MDAHISIHHLCVGILAARVPRDALAAMDHFGGAADSNEEVDHRGLRGHENVHLGLRGHGNVRAGR